MQIQVERWNVEIKIQPWIKKGGRGCGDLSMYIHIAKDLSRVWMVTYGKNNWPQLAVSPCKGTWHYVKLSWIRIVLFHSSWCFWISEGDEARVFAWSSLVVSPPALGIYISSSPYARIGGYAYSWTLIQVHPCSQTHTHTHRKGLFYEVNVNKSRFFFRSLHCFFSLFFLCFSHIETTPHQISYPSQVSPPPKNEPFPDYVTLWTNRSWISWNYRTI